MHMSTICHAIVQLTAAATITVFVYRKTPHWQQWYGVDATAWSLTLLCLFSLFLKGDYLIITTLQQRKKTRIVRRRSSSSNIKGKIILFIQRRTNVRLSTGLGGTLMTMTSIGQPDEPKLVRFESFKDIYI